MLVGFGCGKSTLRADGPGCSADARPGVPRRSALTARAAIWRRVSKANLMPWRSWRDNVVLPLELPASAPSRRSAAEALIKLEGWRR